MTEVPFLLVLAVGSICLFLLGFFQFKNQKLKRIFSDEMKDMDSRIQIHRMQIENRQKSLNTYDFLLRNLKEALKIQTDCEL